MSINPTMFQIDRSKPFNPVDFIGSGWTIEEEDKRSIALTELDLKSFIFDNMLRENAPSINGEDRLMVSRSLVYPALDAKICQSFFEKPCFIPDAWKFIAAPAITYLFFDGTILRTPRGHRSQLYLCWDNDQWCWRCHWLRSDCGPSDISPLYYGLYDSCITF